MKTTAWYADRYKNKFGMSLVQIKPESKLPSLERWQNLDPHPDHWEQNPLDNIGINLGASNYCSLDIDCLESFKLILEEFGIPIETLDNCPTIQGASKGKRVMFRVPDGVDLPYVKLNWPKKDDPKKHFTVFELRSSNGDKAKYDALPPSIHPDTKQPYKWLVQPRVDWPTPPDWLIAIWVAWDSFKPQLKDACPWFVKEPRKTKPRIERTHSDSDIHDVQGAYINSYPLDIALVSYGYKPVGKRYLSPHSGTGLPGVIPFDDMLSCWIHHASDPLCSEESGQPVSSYDLFCYYEHNNDKSKAFKAAADLLGISLKKKRKATKEYVTKVEATQPVAQPSPPAANHPFNPLGYNGTSYYYLPRGTEQVAEIKRASHTSPSELLSLASIEWWEFQYPKDKGGVDWQGAASVMMRMCERKGIYSTDRERGRGAWHDAGRGVLHLGNRLLVDSVPVSIPDFDTEYIYTRLAPLEIGADSIPATDQEGTLVLGIIKELNWSKPDQARLLAGWCFLSTICGALPWRPHVWLTAKRGAGKTWIQDHIISPLIGQAAMMVQGSTTEAGIRQKLKQDARPIVFDEAESEDQNSQKRMQTVIELARQSSSDSTAEIVKGTVGGQGMSFRMRSMFLLGSINVALSHAADESRFSVLTINPPEKTQKELDRFDKFSKHVDNTLTSGLCAKMRSRAYRLMPIIRQNCKTFSRAVAEILGSQRLGDQVGTLIAGEYSMVNSDIISIEKAREWIFNIDLEDAKEAEQVSDEENCLSTILEQQIRFDSEKGNIQRSIGELVFIASGREFEHGVTAIDANSVLERHGLKVDFDVLIVATKHNELAKLLKNTAWFSGWSRVLLRIDESESYTKTIRFAGVRSRAIAIKIAKF